MSPEGERAAEVREWLQKAALDLRGAQLDLKADPPLTEDALFHSQQIAEKALKAFLVWHDVAVRKTHSIEELGHAACQIESALEPLVNDAVPLTEYAWAFRYPGALPSPQPGEATRALEVAVKLVSAVLARLPADAVPPELSGL